MLTHSVPELTHSSLPASTPSAHSEDAPLSPFHSQTVSRLGGREAASFERDEARFIWGGRPRPSAEAPLCLMKAVLDAITRIPLARFPFRAIFMRSLSFVRRGPARKTDVK